MFRSSRLRIMLAGVGALMLLAACGSDDNGDDPAATTPAGGEETAAGGETDLPELTDVKVGYVSAVDQMGAPMALDIGFYDEQNLNVQLAQPFPTGVDALAALDAGDIDFVQVGTPSIGAVLEGMDLAYLGNYTGSSSQLGIDETMAMVATGDSNIDLNDPSSFEGKKIGISEGSINHLYLLGLLKELGVAAESVEMVNTAPPDMGAGLQGGSLDAAVIWDPWPIQITKSVSGTSEVVRGGGYIPFIGYIIAKRDYVEANPEVVESFLAARAKADKWMRENPDEAAKVTTRWIEGIEQEVAQEAMQYNIKQLDPRFSACNYLALDTMMGLLKEQDAVAETFDVNEHFMPEHILNVMEANPELFDDLPDIPDQAQITADYEFKQGEAEKACPAS